MLADDGVGYAESLGSILTTGAAVGGAQAGLVGTYVPEGGRGRADSNWNGGRLLVAGTGDGKGAAAGYWSGGAMGGTEGCCCDGRLLFFGEVGDGNFCAPATGSDRPRSLPLLATPFPQVNCVLYPAQSFPSFKHWEQYGLRRSHFTARVVHVKQSAAAPAAGARFLLLRGGFTPLESGGRAAISRGASTCGTDMVIAAVANSANIS